MLTGPNIRSLRPHVGPVSKRVYSPRSEGLRETGPLFVNPIPILGRPARPMAGLVLRTYGPRMVRDGPETPDFYTLPPGIRPLNPLRKSKVQYGRIHAPARNIGSGKVNLVITEPSGSWRPRSTGNPAFSHSLQETPSRWRGREGTDTPRGAYISILTPRPFRRGTAPHSREGSFITGHGIGPPRPRNPQEV